MVWVVMDNAPGGDFGFGDERCGVERRRVAPAHFLRVLLREVLRFVDEEIARLEEVDEALVLVEEGGRDLIERAVKTGERFAIRCVADGLVRGADFKAVGDARVAG